MNREKTLTGYPSVDKPWEREASFFAKHPIIPNINIYTLAKLINAGNMDAPAVDCLDLRASYHNLFADAKTVSAALKVLGVKRGQIVSICLPICYQALVLFFACNRIGAVCTFLDFHASEAELEGYIKDYHSPLHINYDKTAEENAGILQRTGIDHIITLGKESLNSRELFAGNMHLNEDKFVSYNTLGHIAKRQKHSFEPHHWKREPCLILYTSGTTGKQKSVTLTNENVIAAMTYMKNTGKAREASGNRVLVSVPFKYPYGLVTSAIATLLWKKEAVLAPEINKNTINFYFSKNPSIIFGTPALLDLAVKYVPENADLSSVTYFISGGDYLTAQAQKRGEEFFLRHNSNAGVGSGFGNAETCSVGSNTLGVPSKPGTAGKLITGIDAVILDPVSLEELKMGEDGLLCISGKHVFHGYYHDRDETEAAFLTFRKKKFFKTETIGNIDKDGYFTPVSRTSRFYILSQSKVYCDSVQTVIASIPEIADCALVKVPGKERLYDGFAFVIPSDPSADREALKSLLLDCFHNRNNVYSKYLCSLKDYEYPSYVEIVDKLPRRAGMEKIDYSKLEEMAAVLSECRE